MLVRLLRALKGWKQEEFADEAGLDPSSIHRYETGQMEPSEEARERMARAAGVSPAFLRGRLVPFLSALRAEASGGPATAKAGIEERADEVGRRVGAAAREEARAYLAGLKAQR